MPHELAPTRSKEVGNVAQWWPLIWLPTGGLILARPQL